MVRSFFGGYYKNFYCSRTRFALLEMFYYCCKYFYSCCFGVNRLQYRVSFYCNLRNLICLWESDTPNNYTVHTSNEILATHWIYINFSSHFFAPNYILKQLFVPKEIIQFCRSAICGICSCLFNTFYIFLLTGFCWFCFFCLMM